MNYVTQTHHRTEYAALEDENHHKQEEQGGQADHHLRGRSKRFGRFGCGLHVGNNALVQQHAKAFDSVVCPFEFQLIALTKQQRNGLLFLATGDTVNGCLLFILEIVYNFQSVVQQRQLFARCPRIFELSQRVFDILQLGFFRLIFLKHLGLFLDDVKPRQIGEHPGVCLDLLRQLIEDLALFNGFTFDVIGVGSHQHDDAGGNGQAHRDTISPVRDRGDSHLLDPSTTNVKERSFQIIENL